VPVRVHDRVVELHIERLTIDASPGVSAARLQEAIERELTVRMVSAPLSADRDQQIDHLDGGELKPTRDPTSRTLGENIAGGVDTALRGATGAGSKES
jgi:hypothetical protein